MAFLESRPAPMVIPAFEFDFSGDEEFLGQNPPEAAAITYYLKKRHMIGDLKLEVYDSAGKLISTVPGGKRKGINRVYWPMRLNAAQGAGGGGTHREPLLLLRSPGSRRDLHREADQGQGHLHLDREPRCSTRARSTPPPIASCSARR